MTAMFSRFAFGLLASLELGRAASTITVKVNTGACPAGSGLAAPTIFSCVYSAINSAGQPTQASTTFTQAPGRTETQTVTQTVFVTSGRPTQSIYTTIFTNSDGQTLTSVGTSTISDAPSTTEDPTEPSATGVDRYPCPRALADNFMIEDGSDWQIFCDTDLYYHDLQATNADTLYDCMLECANLNLLAADDPESYDYHKCVAVTFTAFQASSGSNCFLKYDVGQIIYNSTRFDSAKLESYDLPDEISVSVYSTPPPVTTVPVATAIPEPPYQPADECPYPDRSFYSYPGTSPAEDETRQPGYIPPPSDPNDPSSPPSDIDTNPDHAYRTPTYQIICDRAYTYNELPSLYTNSVEECINACTDWKPIVAPNVDIALQQPCIAVTYHQFEPAGAGGGGNLTLSPAAAVRNCHRHYAFTYPILEPNPPAILATRVDFVPYGSQIYSATYGPGATVVPRL